jgi:hypothetical protein
MTGQIIISVLLTLCSLGVVVGFFVSTERAFKKFNCLNSRAQGKLLLLEYYMAAVRNLPEEDLALFGNLPEDEIQSFNLVYDYGERIQTIREKIALLDKHEFQI